MSAHFTDLMSSHLRSRGKDGDQNTIYILKKMFAKLMISNLNAIREKILDIFTHILDLSNKKGGNLKLQKLINPSFFLKLYNKTVQEEGKPYNNSRNLNIRASPSHSKNSSNNTLGQVLPHKKQSEQNTSLFKPTEAYSNTKGPGSNDYYHHPHTQSQLDLSKATIKVFDFTNNVNNEDINLGNNYNTHVVDQKYPSSMDDKEWVMVNNSKTDEEKCNYINYIYIYTLIIIYNLLT